MSKPDPKLPLADIRIVSVEQYGAGPFATLHLADLGAEVIKIEDPSVGGDVGRYVPPYAEGEDSLFFEAFNRNKKSISLNLNTPAGRSVFEDLVKISDVVYSNLRGDVPAKMRLTYNDLKHLNPAIVSCSLTGFGMTGPRSKEPGYDYILQGLAGWMDLTGEPDGPPSKSGLSMVDYSGGLVSVISILTAVHAARRDGIGMDCDVSLYDTAIGMLTYPAAWHLNAGFEPVRTRHSAHPSLVPFQAFEASDGWLIIACAKEKFWQRLTDVIERPEMAQDARFLSFTNRLLNASILIPSLEEIIKKQSVDFWLSKLYAKSIPCGPINTVAQSLVEPHTIAREMIIETDHPRFGKVKQVASPVKVGTIRNDHHRAPQRNEHADYVLTSLLHYDKSKVALLETDDAFTASKSDPK
jgi:crotonobetainyl-CoA:carnitine CoA-transferase CaiB-like acyl-CoA transferase